MKEYNEYGNGNSLPKTKWMSRSAQASRPMMTHGSWLIYLTEEVASAIESNNEFLNQVNHAIEKFCNKEWGNKSLYPNNSYIINWGHYRQIYGHVIGMYETCMGDIFIYSQNAIISVDDLKIMFTSQWGKCRYRAMMGQKTIVPAFLVKPDENMNSHDFKPMLDSIRNIDYATEEDRDEMMDALLNHRLDNEYCYPPSRRL